MKITHSHGFEVERITNKTPEEVQEIMAALTKLEDKNTQNIRDCLKRYRADYIPIIVGGGRNSGMPQFNNFEIDLVKKEITMMSHLSPAKQAEGIINRLEFAKTAFSDDERNLIVNYAFKLNDMEKTRELAERNQGAVLAVIDAQTEIDDLPDPMIGLWEMEEYGYTWGEMRQFQFAGTESLKRRGIIKDNLDAIKPENYNLVYVGELSELQGRTQSATLEMVFEKFNIDHPADYKGHSLSVSDIVVLHEDGKNSAHFVDSFGFTGLPDFMRELEGVEEQEKEGTEPEVPQEEVQATSRHDVNHSARQNDLKSEPGQAEMEQPKPEPAQTEQPKPEKEEHQETERPEPQQEETPETKQAEPQSEQNKPEKADKAQAFEDFEDEDEIIDLGDEKDQVLAQMKKSLKGEQETELAFQIADRFISIQEVDGGYDYSIMGADYKEIDGGVYDNPDVSIREALDDILTDLKDNPFDNDELTPIDYDGLMEKVEAANAIEPQAQGNVVENFKAKTNELFHEISEMNPAEIEETVKCHVQAQLDESGIDAEIVDVAVVGSRCRGLEQEGSDLDVVVELSTSEREDVLFDTFNGDAFHIGGVKVDINPITAQRTGTLEIYLPQEEDYLEGVREAREKEPVSLSQEQAETEVTLTVAECGDGYFIREQD